MKHQYFVLFVAAWAALGIGGTLVLGRLENPAPKRIVWRVMNGLGVSIMLLAVWFFHGSTKDLLFIGPAVLLIFVLNVSLVRVCDSCAALVYPRYFVSANFCPKCGAPLR